MSYPPELYIVFDENTADSGDQTDFSPIKTELYKRFDGIVIKSISFAEVNKMLNGKSKKPFRVILLLTDYIDPRNKAELPTFFYLIDQTQSKLIMHPTSVSSNPSHLEARSIRNIIECLTKFQAGMQTGSSNSIRSQNTGFSSQTGVSSQSNVGASPSSQYRSTFTSVSNLNNPKLGIVIFGSDNQIFNRDMNLLYNRYGNDPRVKIHQVKNLAQIPMIPGNEYYVFVSDQDTNFFIPQLTGSAGRTDRFIPILYNTSSRMIRPDGHFSIAASDISRAYAEIDNRLNSINVIGSTGTLPPSMVSGQIPMGVTGMERTTIVGGMTSGVVTSGGLIPGGITSGGLMPIGTSTSRTVIQNPVTSGYTKRLIVLDPGSLFFQQFYKLLPIDYKLINHLQQNAYFKQPTILLAPYQAKDHVLSRIAPDADNIGVVFYSQSPASVTHRFSILTSSNPREIQQFLKINGVVFMTEGMVSTTMMRSGIGFESNFHGRQSHIVGGQLAGFGSNTTLAMNNQWNNWGGDSIKNKEWIVRRFPGSHKYDTYTLEQEGMFQNRSMLMNTRIGGSLESNQNVFEIREIPNQSQVRVNQTIVSPPRNNLITQVTEVQRTVIPLQLAQTVTEEVFQQNTISVRNKPQSNFHHENSMQSITIDQIPIAEVVPIPVPVAVPIPVPVVPVVPTVPLASPRQLSSASNTITMNIEPTYVPPPPPPVQPVIERIIREEIKVAPQTTIVQVPSITNGYYTGVSTTTIPTQTRRVSYTPPKIPATNVVTRRVVEEDWVDPIKYEKIIEGGRTKYVMRTDYINKIREEQRYGGTIYDTIESPRVNRRSRVVYDTVVKPAYNDVEYIVESPRIRRSRVLYQDIPTTTIISPSTQVLETSFTSPAIDLANVETRIENGISVYTRKANVSPLRRSNMYSEQYTTPIQYTTSKSPVYVDRPLRRSVQYEQRIPIRTSRVVVQSPEVVEIRRSNSGTRGSRVIRTEGEFYLNNRPVHLVFKKLNSLLGSTSQYFNDPRYTVHKYYSTNQLAAIANSIPVHEPVVLVVDDVPESLDYFTNHSHFNTVVIPKNRSSYRSQQVKYPKYKWILQEDPERAYGEIVTYLDEFAYAPSRTITNYNRASRAVDDVRYLSPNNYNTYTSSYNTVVEPKTRMVNSSKKVLLFPVDRSEVKDFVQSRLPHLFDFIPYTDMNSLTKQLDYWPGSNLVVVLSEPLAQQIGTATRISRNADFIVYDPNNKYGYIKQEYNSIKRVRTVHDLVIELEDIMGMGAKAEYRRQNRSYHI